MSLCKSKSLIVSLIFIVALFSIVYNVNADDITQSIAPVKTTNCAVLPQAYANSSFQIISAIQLPNKTLITINTAMNYLGNGLYSYTFCNTTINGEYVVNGIGDIDGTNQTWRYNFIVNPLGIVFTTGQAILYLMIFFVLFLVFMGTLIFGIYIPSGNDRDAMTGYIIAVSNLKYLKLLSIAMSYLSLTLIFYVGWMISYAYLNLDFMGDLCRIAFYAMVIVLPVFFVLMIYFLIANWVRDSKLAEMLQRGLHVR